MSPRKREGEMEGEREGKRERGRLFTIKHTVFYEPFAFSTCMYVKLYKKTTQEQILGIHLSFWKRYCCPYINTPGLNFRISRYYFHLTGNQQGALLCVVYMLCLCHCRISLGTLAFFHLQPLGFRGGVNRLLKIDLWCSPCLKQHFRKENWCVI